MKTCRSKLYYFRTVNSLLQIQQLCLFIGFGFFSQVKNVTLHCLHLHLKTIKLKQLHKIGSWLSLRESFTFTFQSQAVDRLIFVGFCCCCFFFFQAAVISFVFIFLEMFECCWFQIVHFGRNAWMYFLYSALIMRRTSNWLFCIWWYFLLYLWVSYWNTFSMKKQSSKQ